MQETGIQWPCSHYSARWLSKTLEAKAIQAIVPHLWPQESLQGAGKGSSCIHTALCTKKPWPSPPPLAFPEPLQDTLPQWAHIHTILAASSSIRGCNRLWQIADGSRKNLGQNLKFISCLHYPTTLTSHVPTRLITHCTAFARTEKDTIQASRAWCLPGFLCVFL